MSKKSWIDAKGSTRACPWFWKIPDLPLARALHLSDCALVSRSGDPGCCRRTRTEKNQSYLFLGTHLNWGTFKFGFPWGTFKFWIRKGTFKFGFPKGTFKLAFPGPPPAFRRNGFTTPPAAWFPAPCLGVPGFTNPCVLPLLRFLFE